MVKKNNKMKLHINAKLPLQLHIFTVRPKSFLDATMPERMEMALAYKIEGAYASMEGNYGPRMDMYNFKHHGGIDIDNILKALDGIPISGSKKVVQPKMTIKIVDDNPTEKRSENIDSYLFNLKYVKDKFSKILTDTDKKSLDRIINKVGKHLAKK